MCGIVGAAGSLFKKELDAFNNLLAWDIVRGPHATGVVSVKKAANEVHMLKRAMHAYDLMDLKAYDVTIQSSKVLIGHNRYATVGGNSHRNAHPFWCDNIIGVHNGTIPYSDRRDLVDHTKYDTDSEAIYWNINNRGLEETIKDLRGAWSLVWWDRRDHTLNFLRNKERPMFYTLSKSGQDLFWASEVGMLRAALARNGVEHGEVWQTSEDTWYSFTIPDASKAFEEPKRKEVKGASPFVFQSAHSQGRFEEWDHDQWMREYRQRNQHHSLRAQQQGVGGTEENKSPPALQLTGPGTSSHKPASAEKLSEKPPEGDSSGLLNQKTTQTEDKSEIPFTLEQELDTAGQDKVVPLGRRGAYIMIKDYNGGWINKSEFEKRTKDGCAYCQKQIQFRDVANRTSADDIPILWLGRTSFLCVECSDDSEILEYLANCNMVIPERQRLN